MNICRAENQESNPDSKVHGANMGPIWGRQDPGGPHVGPMNYFILESFRLGICTFMYVFVSFPFGRKIMID